VREPCSDAATSIALDQRVLGLERLDRSDLPDPPQLLDVEVGDADVLDEALFLELGECSPALLDVCDRDRPVDLVEIDRADAEPAETAIGFAEDRVALQAVSNVAVGAFEERALGEDVRALGEPLERATDDLLGAAEADAGDVEACVAELSRLELFWYMVLLSGGGGLGLRGSVGAAAPQ
jgi:hypothetical protein